MISDLFIGNFGTEGFERTVFIPEEERPATPGLEKAKPANGKPTAERQEFERVIGAIMGVVRNFPEVLREVVAALKEERDLCLA